MATRDILTEATQWGVVPVIALEREEDALPLADALLAGGLPVMEITFRTAAAAAAIHTISTERPEMLVGAGTVLTQSNLQDAKDCGARFAVAPGLNPEMLQAAKALDLPFVPGIATPSDIEMGLALGCTTLKFFPAGALGGVAMLKALSGPYAHTGIRFMPTGGVNLQNLGQYLSLPTVSAVGGTWLAKSADIATGNWDVITAASKEAITEALQFRSL